MEAPEAPAEVKKQKPGKQKPKPTPKQVKEKVLTLKMLIQRLVPYSSAVYAEHIFRELGVDGNQKCTLETIDSHIPHLVSAA